MGWPDMKISLSTRESASISLIISNLIEDFLSLLQASAITRLISRSRAYFFCLIFSILSLPNNSLKSKIN